MIQTCTYVNGSWDIRAQDLLLYLEYWRTKLVLVLGIFILALAFCGAAVSENANFDIQVVPYETRKKYTSTLVFIPQASLIYPKVSRCLVFQG